LSSTKMRAVPLGTSSQKDKMTHIDAFGIQSGCGGPARIVFSPGANESDAGSRLRRGHRLVVPFTSGMPGEHASGHTFSGHGQAG
jgi:hypothetical protein